MKSDARKFREPQNANRNQSCPACGTLAVRDDSKFCRVCGKSLGEDYEPLDSLRASYNLQRKNFRFEKTPIISTENLFEKGENFVSETAWAFAVYSLVPYLGILFCPGAILIGGIGVLKANRHPYVGGKTSRNSILIGAIVFAGQVFLWWLLYVVPELGK